MQNLLPTDEHRKASRVYHVRLGAVVAWLGAGVCALGAATMLPSVFQVESDMRALDERRDALGQSIAQREADGADAQIGVVKDRLEFVYAEQNEPMLWRRIDAVARHTNANISVRELVYTRAESASSSTMQVRGVAADRQTIQSFRQRLADMPAVVRVELPVEQLAQQQNIEFTLTLTGNL